MSIRQIEMTTAPVRELAAELRVNPNTTATDYQNLERVGFFAQFLVAATSTARVPAF